MNKQVMPGVILAALLVASIPGCLHPGSAEPRAIVLAGSRTFTDIAWTPNADRLVAISTPYFETLDADIFLVSYPQGTAKKVTNRPGWFSLPAWSTDGSRLALVVNLASVWLFDPASASLTYLAEGEGAAWLPDGTGLAIYDGTWINRATQDRDIKMVDLQGRTTRVLTLDTIRWTQPEATSAPGTLGEYLSGISISPDGSVLLLSLDRIGGELGEARAAYSVQLASGEVLPFMPGEPVGSVAWAPDGKRVAYTLVRPLHTAGQLGIADPHGHCLWMASLSPQVTSPTWSQDGSQIAFLYEQKINVLDLKGFPPTKSSSGCP
jgi:Tol biopolymer transport system component